MTTTVSPPTAPAPSGAARPPRRTLPSGRSFRRPDLLGGIGAGVWLATVGIFVALQVWNEFLFPLVLTQTPSVRVLTLGLWDFQGQYGANVPLLTAAVTISLPPLVVVYLLGRRFLLAGITAGAGR